MSQFELKSNVDSPREEKPVVFYKNLDRLFWRAPREVQHVGSVEKDLLDIDPDNELFPHAAELIALLQTADSFYQDDGDEWAPRVLIAGGFVRDLVVGGKPHDIDLATSLPYEEVKRVIEDYYTSLSTDCRVAQNDTTNSEKYTGVVIRETGKNFGVLRVEYYIEGGKKEEYEVATFRVESDYADSRRPEQVEETRSARMDVQRRDFTVNALVYDPKFGNVVDYVGGLEDARNKTLRFVGNPQERINEDALRALRYVRFLLKLEFNPDKESQQAISTSAENVQHLPADRIRDELNKMLTLEKGGEVLRKFKELGMLKEILPGIDSLSECEQGPPYHLEGDVFVHTCMLLDNLPKDADIAVQLAAIFHDVAKPQKRNEREDGRVSFVGHEQAGFDMVHSMLGQDGLKYDKKTIKRVQWLVQNHLVPLHLAPERQSIGDEKLRRFALETFFANHDKKGSLEEITLTYRNVGHMLQQLGRLGEADIRSSWREVDEGSDSERIKEEVDHMHQRLVGLRKWLMNNCLEASVAWNKSQTAIEIIRKHFGDEYHAKKHNVLIRPLQSVAIDEICKTQTPPPDVAVAIKKRMRQEVSVLAKSIE